jgi:hypothetical protein
VAKKWWQKHGAAKIAPKLREIREGRSETNLNREKSKTARNGNRTTDELRSWQKNGGKNMELPKLHPNCARFGKDEAKPIQTERNPKRRGAGIEPQMNPDEHSAGPQPQFDAESGCGSAQESLLRMREPS